MSRSIGLVLGLAACGPSLLPHSLPGEQTPSPSLPPCALAPRGDACIPEEHLRLFDETRAPAPEAKPKKRFWLAAGEVLFINMLPWIYGRLIVDDPIARVGPDSWASNFKDLPDFYRLYDRDPILVNQISHPGVSGSFYFNAARTNGYPFWESVPWVLTGSLAWETFFETEKVDISDVASTFLGGVNWGEITYRSTRMLLDDQDTGVTRVLRELGTLVLDPAAFVTRLATGELWRVGPNPPDRLLPDHLVAVLELGYRRRGNENPKYPDQALVSGVLRYGDPFDDRHRQPFDVFQVSAEFAQPSSTLVTRFDAFGLVTDGELAAGPRGEHRIGIELGYIYENSLNRVYQDENIRMRVLSRFPLGGRTDLLTDVGIAWVPLAAVESDYPQLDLIEPSPWMSIGEVVGRTYDYAPGGSAGFKARIRRDEVDRLAVGYAYRLVHTVNGIADNTRVQTAFAEGRIPLTHALAAGAGWAWDDRFTTYQRLPSVHRAASEWRLFASWTLR